MRVKFSHLKMVRYNFSHLNRKIKSLLADGKLKAHEVGYFNINPDYRRWNEHRVENDGYHVVFHFRGKDYLVIFNR